MKNIVLFFCFFSILKIYSQEDSTKVNLEALFPNVIDTGIKLTGSKFNEYLSGDKLDLEVLSDHYDPDGSIYKFTSLPSEDRYQASVPTYRSELNSMITVKKIYHGSKDSGIVVPGFGGVKLGKDHSTLSLYFLETKIVINQDGSETVYGIGYSMHYLFIKVKKGLTLSSLSLVSAAAELDNTTTEVYCAFKTYGITGTGLIKFMKPLLDEKFDVEGYAKLQAKIDGVSSILSDNAFVKEGLVKYTPVELNFITPEDLR